MTAVSSTIGHANYLLSEAKSPLAYRLGPRASIGLAKEMLLKQDSETRGLILSDASPFARRDREQFLNRLSESESQRKSRRYSSFEEFCLHVSRRAYIPTKHILDLLPTMAMTDPIREHIAISVSAIKVNSLIRISPSGYAALTDSDEVVFIFGVGGIPRAFSEEMILRMALYLLCWAGSIGIDIPADLAYKSLPPPEAEVPRILSEKLAREMANVPISRQFSIYAKILIPLVVENAGVLHGIITSRYGERYNGEAVTAEHVCPICYEGIQSNSPVITCRNGHACHRACIEQWLQTGGVPRCPTCRESLRISR